jgi:para-nitrobenzyl esterase
MAEVARDPLIRQTSAGAIRGSREGDVLSWKGVPYAAPPVGEQRFRRPSAPRAWPELRDATRFGPLACQRILRSMEVVPGVGMSEDCLTLNVWAPDGALADPKPVMVWIHGGGYFSGSTAQRYYDGRHLVENGDVVVVTVNYRLGVFGFVDLSTLDRGEWGERGQRDETRRGRGSSFEQSFDSNVGLRDQIFALEWVRDNIRAFGGDPDNVTLFGESAGGACVIALMASPLTEGLFHRVIAQSAPVTSVYGPQRARSVAERLLSIVGIDPEHAQRLRYMLPADLVDAGSELIHQVSSEVPGTLALAPVVDGDVLPDYPLTLFREGRAHRIPLVIGTNRDESSFFKLMRSPLMPITPASVEQMFVQIAADRPEFEGAHERITGAYPRYPRRRSPEEVSRDAGFRMPSIWLAEAHSRFAPTWMYRFDHATPLLKAAGIGATHASELAYVFGSFAPRGRDVVFGLGGRREALQVSGRMQARWLAFANTGVPQAAVEPDASGKDAISTLATGTLATGTLAAGTLVWPQYDAEQRLTLRIDRADAIVADPDAEIREAWGAEVLAFS